MVDLAALVKQAESRVGQPMFNADGSPLMDYRGEKQLTYVSGYAKTESVVGVVSVSLQRVAGCSIKRRHWRETWELDGKRIALAKLVARLKQ